MPSRLRLDSLDGLRGVAAVIVLVHHALLTFPSLADAYYDLDGRSDFSLPWVISYTPLHAFWAGTEAVYLFFILSGVVLVLPVVRAGSTFSWLAYYPRRVLRLYLPVVVAIAFGLVLAMLAARFQDPELGAWMNARKDGYTLEWLARDIILVFGASGVISPLWSLRWEVVFSLLLPAFVVFAVRARRLWWAKLAAVFVLIAAGSIVDSPYLFFLPMFAVGALLVAEWERVGDALGSLNGRRWTWPAFIVVAFLMTTSRWTLLGLGVDGPVVKATGWLPVLGVTMLVLAAAFFVPAIAALSSPPVTWLGRISFALYLVHEPLIVAARVWTFPNSPLVGLLISVPLAFLVAALFARLVEQPSHVLAKRVGTWAAETPAFIAACRVRK